MGVVHYILSLMALAHSDMYFWLSSPFLSISLSLPGVFQPRGRHASTLSMYGPQGKHPRADLSKSIKQVAYARGSPAPGGTSKWTVCTISLTKHTPCFYAYVTKSVGWGQPAAVFAVSVRWRSSSNMYIFQLSIFLILNSHLFPLIERENIFCCIMGKLR